jgi:hypothetical protein
MNPIAHNSDPGLNARTSIMRFPARTAWLAVLALLFSFTPLLRAQENATINGTVTDASGAVVANAQLTLTNTATGQIRNEVSNSVGAYRFGNVGIGTYNLDATASGFSKYSKTGIVVNVAQTLEEDIQFKVGASTTTVSVQAEALQTQTETSEVSTLISGQQVEELSTNGNNVTALAALGLGVSNNLPPFSGVDALTSANGISFNGTRTEHNIYLLDGAEQNDRGCGGCFMNLPSQESIAEFQTLDSNYSPDYGIGSGGTITLVLKSGTHDFHGEGLRVQPQHRLRRQRLLRKAGEGIPPHLPAQRARRQHRRTARHPWCLQQRSQPHLLLLERGMAPPHPGQYAPRG